MTVADWEHPATDNLVMVLPTQDWVQQLFTRLAVVINRSHAPHPFRLPASLDGEWRDALTGAEIAAFAPPRSVSFFVEVF
jgi:glycogen operon protein